MKIPSKNSIKILAATVVFSLMAFAKKEKTKSPTATKIQVAILLDVSNSMDGLIEQAKSQLWNMVNIMGKTQNAENTTPQIEIALYEYGRTSNSPALGYVKKINGFISDLDSLSQNLFKLTTNGGEEYCGQVIYTSLKELNWDVSPQNYKVIFIAGNEDFLQGTFRYTTACAEAQTKGVIVNTIYCGDKAQGIREHWNLGGECGNGSFTNIDQNAKIEDIPTPYDSLLITYNDKLNGTYIGYGKNYGYFSANQTKQDKLNFSLSKSAGLKRLKAKSNGNLYSNSQWDLVDAQEKNGAGLLDKMDKKDLPDSLQNKSTDELKKLVDTKSKERNTIQKEIAELNVKRDAFITAEKIKANSTKTNAPTLETEIERTIRVQAKRFNMSIN